MRGALKWFSWTRGRIAHPKNEGEEELLDQRERKSKIVEKEEHPLIYSTLGKL